MVERAQFRAGIDAELVGEHPPGIAVGGDRLGAAARLVQRPHQQHPQCLAERVIADQPAHLGHELARPAAAKLGGGPQLQRGQPGLLQPVRLGRHQPGGRHVRQRGAAPQRQRIAQQARCLRRVPGAQRLPALRGQRLEDMRVQVALA